MCDLPSWIQAHAAAIQAAAAIVLAVVTTWTLIVLRRYAADTATIARASVEQLKASFQQVKASIAQVEALHTPCLTIHATQRDFHDALFDDDARTDMILFPRGGQAAIENYGTGPAMNIEYSFKPQEQGNIADMGGYVPYLAPNTIFITKMPRNLMDGHDYLITLTYASLSGQKYRTEVTSKNLALVDYKFTKQE